MRKFKYIFVLALFFTTIANADIKNSKWIWYPEEGSLNDYPGETRYFLTEINIPKDRKIKQAIFTATADDHCKIYVNHRLVADKSSGWGQLELFSIGKQLKPGLNVLTAEVKNTSKGPAGLIGSLEIKLTKGEPMHIVTSESWLCKKNMDTGWWKRGHDLQSWSKVKVIGKYGMPPWGNMTSKGIVSKNYLPEVQVGRPLMKKESEELLKADWLFQANHDPSANRIQKEIKWARELAARISTMDKAPDLTKELKTLQTLEKKIEKSEDLEELYYDVRRVKRKIAFSNPLIDFDEILLVDSPYPVMQHGHSGHESGHRNGCQQTNGGSKLQILKGLNPDGEVRDLLPEGLDTYVWRPDLSYDAKKVLFCKKDKDGPSFQIHEVDIDGKNMKQLTKSPYDDLDPIYLPNGKLMFSTTRANTYVRCLPTSPAFVIARCDADGQNIRIISRNNEPDFLPAMLPSGNIIYTRWEYTERPLWRLQGLWTMNPDGTQVEVYWGNRSSHPDILIEPRPIPDSNKVMFIGAGHHRFFAGCLGIVDIAAGREYPNGLQKITTDIAWPEVGDRNPPTPPASEKYHASGRFAAYKSPWPLGKEDFLVSARDGKEGGGNSVNFSEEFSLYLMDIHGNRELIYRGNNNVWYAMPVKPRKLPPVKPEMVKWPEKGEKAEEGTLYSADVYEGVEDLPRGKAKYLRVFQMDAKTYSAMLKTWRHSGPAVSVLQEDGVKRILGTVPVEDDGSVHFKVPSGKALHFQLLDENYRCLQIMRSFTGVMPGEVRGCTGCHEKNSSAPVTFTAMAKAMRRMPSKLTPPPWGAEESISYERFAQPVLDKHCGACHQGDKNPKARQKLDLTLRGGVPERELTDPKLLPFKEPYLTLVGPAWNAPKAPGPGVGIAGPLRVEGTRGEQGHDPLQPLKPMTMLSYTSPLIKMVTSGKHHNVKIEGEDLRRLTAWVDANCVYRGDKEIRMIDDPPEARVARFPVRPRIKTAPVIDRLQPITDIIN